MKAFEIGDRVNVADRNGTVTEASEAIDIVMVKFDDGTGHEPVNVVMLGRQPVEPGCHVRWMKPDPGYLELVGLVVKSIGPGAWGKYSNSPVVEFFDTNKRVYLKDVVRIADPEPVPNADEQLTELGTDAAKWTDGFLNQFPLSVINQMSSPDLHDLLRGWFANAIEAGRSAGYAEGTKQAAPTDDIARLWAFLVDAGHVERVSPIMRNPVDEAIRVINDLNNKPIFKRGDQVRISVASTGPRVLERSGDLTGFRGRIISPMSNTVTKVELMSNTGTFLYGVPLDWLEHV